MKTKLFNIRASDIREGDIVTVMGTEFTVDSIDDMSASNIIDFTFTNEASIIHLSSHLLDIFAEVSRKIELPTEDYSVIKNVTAINQFTYAFATLFRGCWYCADVPFSTVDVLEPSAITDWKNVSED